MRLKTTCPRCKKAVEVTGEVPFGKYMNYVYTCGHIEVRTKLAATDDLAKEQSAKLELGTNGKFHFNAINEAVKTETEPLVTETATVTDLTVPTVLCTNHNWIDQSYWSLDEIPEYYCEECNQNHTKKHAYKYQRVGVNFIEDKNARCMVADDMGLGKTIQAILALKRNQKELLPALAVVPGQVQINWIRELQSWAFENKTPEVIPLIDRISFIPGFKVYVITRDLLGRAGILDLLKPLGIKTIIADECQGFKDPSSNRTKALISFMQDNHINYFIPLSGTPIKNSAAEYFTMLNLLAPSEFKSDTWFRNYWLDPYNGKAIKDWRVEEFKQTTSRFILRRELKDVELDLPEMRINYRYVEITDPQVKKTYNHQIDLFENFLNNDKTKTGISSGQLLGWLAKLRAITGSAKVPLAVDFVNEFIEATPEEDLITVGIHHQDVRDTLKFWFEGAGLHPLSLSGEDDNIDKDRIAQSFSVKKDSRVLILNMIAGGQGLNLQGCNNFICLERVWNGTDEDQFHKRFHRNGQKKKVNGTYFIAKGTLDEWFHELIYKKRKYVNSAGIGHSPSEETSMGFLREFSEVVVRHRL